MLTNLSEVECEKYSDLADDELVISKEYGTANKEDIFKLFDKMMK